jgi:hypothetical protein
MSTAMPIAADHGHTQRWTVELFERFWAKPVATEERVPQIVAPDIVGYWPGCDAPVRGARKYWKVIADLLALCPDFTLRVLAHATNGEFTFVHWEARATGVAGPFTCTGVDRVRVRDGIVLENRIFCDHPMFRALVTKAASA